MNIAKYCKDKNMTKEEYKNFKKQYRTKSTGYKKYFEILWWDVL